eukprot:Rhum_TRINITY_DN12389_c0_g1::Rhum_TRINITY_DN12389_c0_g1_i1::g.51474::m.51474/K03515/REV1; DNA repair protein REV1
MQSSVDSFSKNSRLAFLGTWKVRLRAMLVEDTSEFSDPQLASELAAAGVAWPASAEPAGDCRYLHIDVDSFFVSVARQMDPSLLGVPVAVVTGGSDWSDVCTASYDAREHGIRKGMSVRRAKALLPSLRLCRTTPALFARLDAVTRKLYKLVLQCTPCVCPLSCDEMYVKAGVSPPETLATAARLLRRSVQRCTGCDVSIGIGETVHAARHATSLAKPPGPGVAFCPVAGMRDASVRSLCGIGRQTVQKLRALLAVPPDASGQGADKELTVADLAGVASEKLVAVCGRTTAGMLQDALAGRVADGRATNHVFGIDRFFNADKKTVSRDLNWGVRPQGTADVRKVIADLCQKVAAEVGDQGTRRVTLRLLVRAAGAATPAKRFGHGRVTKWEQSVSAPPRGTLPSIHHAAVEAFGAYPAAEVREIRGVGVTVAVQQRGTAAAVGMRSLRSYFAGQQRDGGRSGSGDAAAGDAGAECRMEEASCSGDGQEALFLSSSEDGEDSSSQSAAARSCDDGEQDTFPACAGGTDVDPVLLSATQFFAGDSGEDDDARKLAQEGHSAATAIPLLTQVVGGCASKRAVGDRAEAAERPSKRARIR